MKITIFSLPKPFTDPEVRLIQTNAISSWKNLGGSVETIIIGNEEGIAEACERIGVSHIDNIKRSQYGTPLLDDAFKIAKTAGVGDVLIYSNADIIFFDDLLEAIRKLPNDKFLAVGRRMDLDVKSLLNFADKNEVEKLKKEAEMRGTLHSPAGIDYFIFRRDMLFPLPPLVVGRIGWDNFMIWNAKQKNIPVIDVTKEIFAIHQNHKPASQNKDARKTNPEALHNISFIKGRGNSATIEDADLKLEDGELFKNHLHWLPRLKRVMRSFLNS